MIGPNDHRIPYDPWNDPTNPPVAPANDDDRRAIQAAISRHPNHNPQQIKTNLWHDEGRDVSIAAIYGTKAGM